VLSEDFCQKHEIPLVNASGCIRLASQDKSIDRRATTKPMTINFGNKNLTYRFEVFATQIGIDCLIGRDLFKAFGCNISGLLCIEEIPATPKHLGVVADDSEYDANDPQLPEHTLSSCMEYLESAIQRNMDLPSDSFCNLPEAVVHLDTGDEPPVYKRQPPNIPAKLFPFIDRKIQEWLASGRIEECSGSSYNSPLLVAEKKDENGVIGLGRLCLDPRLINKQLKDVKYPIPIIKDIFSKLSGKKIFTTLDLKESFLQFPLHHSDKHKTAFTWNGKCYQFRGSPFGLKHLTFIFQMAMKIVCRNLPFAEPYVDDMVVASLTVEEHPEHVRLAIEALTDCFLRINFGKCKFFRLEVKALGHIISSEGIKIDEEKKANAIDWKISTHGKQIQQFLGLVNYFRDFIPHFATVTAPLDNLRYASRITSALWNSDCQRSFSTLKRILLEAPILNHPDYSVPFSVATDASNFGIGAMLFQEFPEGKRYISFASRALTKSEKNYTVIKKELLGIVFALCSMGFFLPGLKRFMHSTTTLFISQVYRTLSRML
jgi:hypothetical protein